MEFIYMGTSLDVVSEDERLERREWRIGEEGVEDWSECVGGGREVGRERWGWMGRGVDGRGE
jgi:hypothetical protein